MCHNPLVTTGGLSKVVELGRFYSKNKQAQRKV